MKHINITVSGKVQGVFFRASTKRQADLLGVKGLVKNQPDDTVYIEAEADEEVLSEFIKWCRHGPPLANVEKLKTIEDDIVGYKAFNIE